MTQSDLILDDFAQPPAGAPIVPGWALLSDQVMWGRSQGALRREDVAGRPALRLKGRVSLANNGGFVQAARDLVPGGGDLDARGFAGLGLVVCGNGETYNLHLRSADVTRPWQSYRATFTASAGWAEVTLPFAAFVAHRIDAPLDLARLRRIGLVAIGRAFDADLAVARITLLAQTPQTGQPDSRPR